MRTVMKIMGKNTILGVPPGCMAGAGVVGWNRLSGAKVPITIPLLDNTASMLAGIRRYYQSQGRNDVRVVAFAGDGATADAGFQALSGAAERGENIIYICYDNEGYMNTGFQRSGTSSKGSNTSTTPVGAMRKGKAQHKKDLPLLLAMHNAAYVATVSPAYVQDFVRKIEKAKEVTCGLAYIHVLSPCPTGWWFDPKDTIKLARLAVQTNFFPLYEYEDGRFYQTVSVKQAKPVQEFVSRLGKFKHLDQEAIADLQQWTDRRANLLQRLCAESPA